MNTLRFLSLPFSKQIAVAALAFSAFGESSADAEGPLVAYVGTYASPLQNMLPT